MRRIALSLLLVCVGLARGAEPAAPADPLAAALAVLRVNDPRWLDRESTQFATTLGSDPAPLRAWLARLLFRADAFDGIDLTRPALMAWREGRAPLLAVIPLANRRGFLEHFGTTIGDEAPMVRVGERDGTVVYSQNDDQGLSEYRLLISDNTAFLARTVAECRQLAAHALVPSASDAPLSFTASGAFLRSLQPGGIALDGVAGWLPADLLAYPIDLGQKGMATRLWSELATQLETITWEVRSDSDDLIRTSGRVQALADSPLAAWIANQRNQPNRLVPTVRSPLTWLTVASAIVWQGQAERVGQIAGEVAQAASGARWTPVVDEAWKGIWAIADRSGPWAAALDVEFKDRLLAELRFAGEQTRAHELLGFGEALAQGLEGATTTPVTAGTASGFHIARPQGDAVQVATDRQLVQVASTMHAAQAPAEEIVKRLQGATVPEGQPALLAVQCNVTALVRVLAQVRGGVNQQVLPAAECSAALKTTAAKQQLVLEVVGSTAKIAQLIRDAGLLQGGAPVK